MGDGLKISKDKRHRSSSSLGGVVVEGTRSERKLDVRASILEVDDHFAVADARCDELQDKLDLVKGLKKKRRPKKRSMNRPSEIIAMENVPLISVRTLPKKRMFELSTQAARQSCLDHPLPRRGYLDPATVEQRQMVQQLNAQQYKPASAHDPSKKPSCVDQETFVRQRPRRAFAEGDGGMAVNTMATKKCSSLEVACEEDASCGSMSKHKMNKKSNGLLYAKLPAFRRRHVPKEIPLKEVIRPEIMALDPQRPWRAGMAATNRAPRQQRPQQQPFNTGNKTATEERPIVELFNKERVISPVVLKSKNLSHNKSRREFQRQEEPDMDYFREEEIVSEPVKEKALPRCTRRVKYHSRGYELPTVASQMKQAAQKFYYGTSNTTNIPFVVSKSTAPSHNIGVNIQQVLNGIKVQQPLSGIPLTMAHHMGLGHLDNLADTKSQTPSLDTREINVIRVGRRLVRLPSYKYMSYNRLLSLYREGEGLVPRFLRAISRPHYFYTSMYNVKRPCLLASSLATRKDFDGATSKGRAVTQEAKQSLAEYASLYREYERLDKSLKDGRGDAELERRRDQMQHELAAREEHIRRVVQDYRVGSDTDQVTLRASASTAEHSYRFSTCKLDMADVQK